MLSSENLRKNNVDQARIVFPPILIHSWHK